MAAKLLLETPVLVFLEGISQRLSKATGLPMMVKMASNFDGYQVVLAPGGEREQVVLELARRPLLALTEKEIAEVVLETLDIKQLRREYGLENRRDRKRVFDLG